jgi:tetratricopeptide (TPR) repeat protein
MIHTTWLLLFLFLPPSDEDQEFLEEALHSGYIGRYRTAVLDLEDYLSDFPDAADAWAGLSRAERMRGEYARALEAATRWVSLEPDKVGARIELAEVLFLLGRYEESEAQHRAAPPTLHARCELAWFLRRTGRHDEARSLAEESLERENIKSLDADGLLDVSRLYLLLGDLDRAAQAAVYADERFNGRKGKGYRFERYESLLVLGELFRKTRLGTGSGDLGSGNRALSCFRDALKINPALPEALLGLARTRYYAFNFEEAHKQLNRALAVNPVHAGVLAFKAHLLTLTRQYAKALALVERGLETNPRDKALLTQMAGLKLFTGDREEYAALLDQVLAVDPRYGEAYYWLAELLIYHYRFTEAEACLRKSIELDPDFSESYILLGRTLANLGREREAREVLQDSEVKDPFNYPWRNNMLRVLSDLDTYFKVETEPFELMLDVDEAGVMSHYLAEWGRESIAYFEDRFAFEAEGPLLMEMFPDNQDFAVRTVGFTGLGALGACFGKVVTLLSPRARPFRGNFCWASTLHHELCHVFTMQMSNHRIPRWLTEGISVYEESRKNPLWRRNQDMELFNNYHNDRLFKLERFDRDFIGPRILFAYYQAGLMVEFIVERYGLDRLNGMVRAFGKDMTLDGVVRRVLEREVDQLQAEFMAWIRDEKIAPIRCRPFYDEEKRVALVDAAKEHPEEIDLQVEAAWACHRTGKSIDALYFLNRVVDRAPEHAGMLLLQGEIAFEKGDEKRAETYYKKALEQGAEDLFAFRNLGLIARKRGDLDEAIDYLNRAVACFPSFVMGGSPYLILMDIYTKEDREEDAMATLHAMVEQGLIDLDLILRLAGFHETRGEMEVAEGYYLDAVRIDPFQREIHVSRARTLRELGRYGEALQELDIAAEVKPGLEPEPEQGAMAVAPLRDENLSLAEVHCERAAVQLALNDLDAARVSVEKALALVAGHPRALELKKKLEEAESKEPDR